MADTPEAGRWRNWLALALGTIVALFSYFSYAAAFVQPDEGPPTVDGGLVAIGLSIAPFVFIVIAWVSRNPRAGKMVLWSMAALIGLGLALGLISPVLGASAGLGIGAALSLNLPDIPDQMRRRIVAVLLSLAYTTALLFVARPAGVLSGAVIPIIMVGFADEYGAWRWARRRGQEEDEG
jgi:hypothetical protein